MALTGIISTMSNTTQVDYTRYFQYPTLTNIHGRPDFPQLTTLFGQLKTNAQGRHSLLGGGRHGHLGAVLTPPQYALVSQHPYVPSPRPGVLQILPGTAQHEAIRLRAEHVDAIALYRECLDIEQALINQIVHAIDDEYLQELRNDTTNAIEGSIPEIMDFLFTAFGDVEPEDISKMEETLHNYNWNLNEPPAEYFNLIEDLSKAGTAARLPYTAAQLINFGLSVVKKTGAFESALERWYDRPPVEHTWVNFKVHFAGAQRKLKKIRGPTVRDSTFHQVNQLATHLTEDFSTLKSDVLTTLASVNSVSTQDNLLKMVKDLQEQVSQLTIAQSERSPYPNPRGPSTTRGSGGRPLRPRRNVSHYCWTQGACALSKDCNFKAPGHKVDATFTNKMGGSTYYCPAAGSE